MKYEEAIKLKPGTPVLIKSKIVSVDATGDIVYETHAQDQEYEVMHAKTDCQYFHPSCVSLPSEDLKYDPCRLFRKGDKVRVVERNGRHYDTMFDGKIWTVAKDECSYSTLPRDVQVNDGHYSPNCYSVPFYYLELITPVEELKPYEVTESSDYYGVDKDDLEVEAAIFWKKSHPHAKEAAEAECARLNAEYREKNKNCNHN